jgi:hypothetical protein
MEVVSIVDMVVEVIAGVLDISSEGHHAHECYESRDPCSWHPCRSSCDGRHSISGAIKNQHCLSSESYLL